MMLTAASSSSGSSVESKMLPEKVTRPMIGTETYMVLMVEVSTERVIISGRGIRRRLMTKYTATSISVLRDWYRVA